MQKPGGCFGKLGIALLSICALSLPSFATPPSALLKAKQLLENGQCQRAYDEAISMAKNGNAEAQFLVAQTMFGRSEETDSVCPYSEKKPGSSKEGIEWATKSAQGKYAPAMVYIGSRIGFDFRNTYAAKSWQFEYDPQLGLKYLREAEKQGYVKALDALGSAYANGNGVPVDMKQAFSYYDKYEEKSGKPSKDRARFAEKETKTRIGTEVCWGNPYGRNAIIDLSDGRKISIRGTITARSDSFDKVAARVSSIVLHDQWGRHPVEDFTFPGTTLIVGRETWSNVEWNTCKD